MKKVKKISLVILMISFAVNCFAGDFKLKVPNKKISPTCVEHGSDSLPNGERKPKPIKPKPDTENKNDKDKSETQQN